MYSFGRRVFSCRENHDRKLNGLEVFKSLQHYQPSALKRCILKSLDFLKRFVCISFIGCFGETLDSGRMGRILFSIFSFSCLILFPTRRFSVKMTVKYW